MASTSLLFPRIVHMGGGASRLLPHVLQKLQLTRPFVVTDPFLYQKSNIVEDLIHAWKKHPPNEVGVPKIDNISVFYETVPDPTSAVVQEGIRRLQGGCDPDCLVAIGGGSPIDTAKAMAQDCGRTLPVVAVPTTAGTGSEMTRFAVITDSDTGEKRLLQSLAMQPVAALVDYELTLQLPQRVTADTGIDALTHAVEAYVSRKQHTVADVFCREAIRTIGTALRPAFHDGTPAAREALMRAASLAGLAFNHSSVALVHGMSRPLGAHFHLTHGASNAVLFPTLTRWSMESPALSRYATVARELGVADTTLTDIQAATRLLDELLAINEELKVPTLASTPGVSSQYWDSMIPTMAEQALASGSPNNNPRIPTLAEIEDLYRQAYQETW